MNQSQNVEQRRFAGDDNVGDNDDFMDMNENGDENGPCDLHDSVIVSCHSFGKPPDFCNNSNGTVLNPPECILANCKKESGGIIECGGISYNKREMIDQNIPYFISGAFCEFHNQLFKKSTIACLKVGDEWKALNVPSITIKDTRAMFPVLSLQPLNSSPKVFYEMITDSSLLYHGEKCKDDIHVLCTLLSVGTTAMTSGPAMSQVRENYFTRLWMDNASKWSRVYSDVMKKYENDYVHLYFSNNYLKKNKNLKFLQRVKENSTFETYLQYTIYKTPITMFPMFDILNIKSFLPSITRNETNVTSVLHNIQIIDGNFVYGTGNGVKSSFPFAGDDQYMSIEHRDPKFRKIINERKFFHNIEPLKLDSIAEKSSPLSIFPKHENKFNSVMHPNELNNRSFL